MLRCGGSTLVIEVMLKSCHGGKIHTPEKPKFSKPVKANRVTHYRVITYLYSLYLHSRETYFV